MDYKAYNRSNRDIADLEQMMKSFMPFAQKRIGFNRPPTINFESDDLNAKNALGKTGFYDPAKMSISIFVDNRHPKDILRSLSHELVHHGQNCRGDLSSAGAGEQGYAQKDPHLREMEREAYEVGNLCFRDWEDNYKQQTNYVQVQVSLNENKQLRSKTMGINDKLNNALNKDLMERWGYKITEEEEEDPLNEFGAASSREEPGSGERRPDPKLREEDESEEEIVEGDERDVTAVTNKMNQVGLDKIIAAKFDKRSELEEFVRQIVNITPLDDNAKKAAVRNVMQQLGVPEAGTDTGAPERAEEEEALETAETGVEENQIRKIVREAIRRKLKNG